MCGLVGVFGNVTPTLEKAFADMLIIDEIRGNHSTGVAIITSENTFLNRKVGTPTIVKGTYLPVYLLQSKPFAKATLMPPLLMLGHNRSATKGAVTKKNAHPFTKKHITLAHNGTVWNYLEEEKYKIDNDSELLTHLIAEEGIEHTWERMVGAAMLTYWNEEEKTLNFISDNKRPFNFICTENDDTVIWASEPWMLTGVLGRRNIKTEEHHWRLKENVLYTWSFKDKKVSYTSKTLEIKPWYENHYAENYDNIYGFNTGRGRTHTDNRNDFGKKLSSTKRGGYGLALLKDIISKKIFNKNKNYQICFYCNGDVSDQFELDNIFHIDGDIVACEECVITAQERNIIITKDKLI